MTPALIMHVIPGLPSYNGVEMYYLKGVIGLPIVISFHDRGYIHTFFFGNELIDNVIIIGWTDSDFKISRALALVPLPVFQALKAFPLAAMAFSTCSFHHQVSRRQWLDAVVPYTSLVLTPHLCWAGQSLCYSWYPQWQHQLQLQTHLHVSWRPVNNYSWWSLSFQTLRWGMNLCLYFGRTSILISLTRSWCCRVSSLPGITFTSVTSLCMVLSKVMRSICMATFPDLYVMRWLSRFLEHVFQRSRLNDSTYSRILSPWTSGSGLLYRIPPCTSLYPEPARPTWPFQSPHGMRNSNPGILAVTAPNWSKKRSLTSSLDHSVGHSHTEWYPHAGQL